MPCIAFTSNFFMDSSSVLTKAARAARDMPAVERPSDDISEVRVGFVDRLFTAWNEPSAKEMTRAS